MNGSIKLLFDECLGKPLLKDVQKLLAWDDPPPEFGHLLDYFTQGVCDSVWIPLVAKDGWVIITADRAKKSKKIKLPEICLNFKITHILLTGSIVRLKQSQKANAIIAVWEDIKKCPTAPKGSRFNLQMSHQGKPRLKQLI